MRRTFAVLATAGLLLTAAGSATAEPGCVYSGGGWICGGALPPGHDDPARIGGANRFEAAANISATFWQPGEATTVYIANAATPDALVGGASVDGPILLVGYGDQVPAATLAEIDRLAPVAVVALGGPASVTDTQLTAARAAGQ
jgi:hypothetical protein